MYNINVNGDIKNLLKAIAEVTKQVESIPKNGYNSTMKYHYVLERDVVDVLRKSLADKGIVIIPNVVETSEREIQLNGGKSTTISKVIMSYTFFDTQTAASITTYGAGEGQDSLDKGIYKAITGCQKYMLLKTFMIPTGDDPEEDDNKEKGTNKYDSKNNVTNMKPDDKIPEEIAKQIYAIGQKNKTKFNNVLKKYGYKTTYEIQYKNLQAIRKELAS